MARNYPFKVYYRGSDSNYYFERHKEQRGGFCYTVEFTLIDIRDSERLSNPNNPDYVKIKWCYPTKDMMLEAMVELNKIVPLQTVWVIKNFIRKDCWHKDYFKEIKK
jgi:hypothetical protein